MSQKRSKTTLATSLYSNSTILRRVAQRRKLQRTKLASWKLLSNVPRTLRDDVRNCFLNFKKLDCSYRNNIYTFSIYAFKII